MKDTRSPNGTFNPPPTIAKPLVNLSYYAQNEIPDYDFITNLPQNYADYFDSVRGTDMTAMFENCNSLTTLDASSWDTSKCRNMNNMFYNCYSLTTLNIGNWDTSECGNMSSMFRYCNVLTTIDLSKWNTYGVTSMREMFFCCSSLTSLNLSNWDTSACIDMCDMFNGCINLTTIKGALDLSGLFIDSSSVDNMFKDAPKLRGVHLKNVPHSFDLSITGGIEGETYIVDNYIDRKI